MSWCDPCAADPLSADELKSLGVSWLGGSDATGTSRKTGPGGGQPVFVTRLHVRYDRDHFPEDLMLQETADRQNFQTRYVLQHPAKVEPEACAAAAAYWKSVAERKEREAQTVASLTGWNVAAIRAKNGLGPADAGFWQRVRRRLGAPQDGGEQISK